MIQTWCSKRRIICQRIVKDRIIVGVGCRGRVISLWSRVMWLPDSLMVTQISVLIDSSAAGEGMVLIFNPR